MKVRVDLADGKVQHSNRLLDYSSRQPLKRPGQRVLSTWEAVQAGWVKTRGVTTQKACPRSFVCRKEIGGDKGLRHVLAAYIKSREKSQVWGYFPGIPTVHIGWESCPNGMV